MSRQKRASSPPSTVSPAISIRIFASHPLAQAAYWRLFDSQPGFRLVANEDPFTVGVFDGKLDSLDSVLTMTRIRFSSMRPLVVGSCLDENECLRWLFRGVWGAVSYDGYERELPSAIRQVALGQLYYPAPVVARWIQISESQRTQSLALPLTQRERELMEFLLRRLSNKEIAAILRIKESTVKFHVSNIFRKLHVSSRQQVSWSLVPNPTLGPT